MITPTALFTQSLIHVHLSTITVLCQPKCAMMQLVLQITAWYVAYDKLHEKQFTFVLHVPPVPTKDFSMCLYYN